MLLRRYDLKELYERDPKGCLERLEQLAEEEPGGERIYAIAEVAYTIGKRADVNGKYAEALDMYSIAVSSSYLYLFSPDADRFRNPYDPQFRGACDLYNSALEATLRNVNKQDSIRPGKYYDIPVGDRIHRVAVVNKGSWHNEDFDRIEFCSDFDISGLDSTNVTYGIGVPLIAVRRPHQGEEELEQYYPEGLSFPVTALLRVTAPMDRVGSRGERRHPCVLELHDPISSSDIRMAGRLVPLQSDLSTPLAYFLDNPRFREKTDSTLGLLNPNKTSKYRGFFMLEPFDPNRIPVVMVHGLWSSPLTWMPMFNDLRSFSELRNNYQFWFYQYPTGQPFWISATQMRSDLKQLRDTLDAKRLFPKLDQMVLVGHSMGGLVSRMQTIESREDFWRVLSDEPFEKVQGEKEQIEKLASALFFAPNPSIRRVITIGTPHRGSDYANDYTRWLGRKIIKLPTTITDTGYSIVRQNPELFHDSSLLTTNTSIDSLSPNSPIFPVMLRAPRAPWVRYHNIIGVAPESGILFKRSPAASDGVVDFASAHTDDVESEIMVQSKHQEIHRTPRATLEVRRILLEHLEDVRSQFRIAGDYASQIDQVGFNQAISDPILPFVEPSNRQYNLSWLNSRHTTEPVIPGVRPMSLPDITRAPIVFPSGHFAPNNFQMAPPSSDFPKDNHGNWFHYPVPAARTIRD